MSIPADLAEESQAMTVGTTVLHVLKARLARKPPLVLRAVGAALTALTGGKP